MSVFVLHCRQGKATEQERAAVVVGMVFLSDQNPTAVGMSMMKKLTSFRTINYVTWLANHPSDSSCSQCFRGKKVCLDANILIFFYEWVMYKVDNII